MLGRGCIQRAFRRRVCAARSDGRLLGIGSLPLWLHSNGVGLGIRFRANDVLKNSPCGRESLIHLRFFSGVGKEGSKDEKYCWKCGFASGIDQIFCPQCSVVQAPSSSFPSNHAQANFFSLFDLPKRYAVDTASLGKAFFEKQKTLHPDRFINKSDQEQQYATAHSAEMNEAYKTLKSPLLRAIYLLEKEYGIDSVSEGGKTETDMTLLMEIMEEREALHECDNVDDMKSIYNDSIERQSAIESTLAKDFEKGDIDNAVRSTIKLRYTIKLVEEVSKKLEERFQVYPSVKN